MARHKNRMAFHDFQPTGGPLPEYLAEGVSLIPVTCALCGETREVGAPLHEVNETGGCVRTGGWDELEEWDLIVSPQGYLYTFVRILPNGNVLAMSGGNTGYHEFTQDEIKVKVA